MPFEEFYTFRRTLVDELERELIGPSEEEEVIEDPPITQYLSGILFPQGVTTEWFDDDPPSGSDDEEGESPDPPVSLANVRYPSSMGMTFAVDKDFSGDIHLDISLARYAPIEGDGDFTDESTGGNLRRRRRNPPWKRFPLDAPRVSFKTDRPASDRIPVTDGLEVFYRVRPPDANGDVSVTVVLLNVFRAQVGELRDTKSFFQPVIKAYADEGPAPFVERNLAFPTLGDEEIESYRLLFRHIHTYAVGHGCSVEWEESANDSDRALEIRTTYSPTKAVRIAESNPEIDTKGLTMATLANGSPQDVVQNLRAFCTGYRKWIEEQTTVAQDTLSVGFKKTAGEHISSCEESASRIERGVNLLGRDAKAMESFQLANQVMLEQRARTEWLKADSGDSPSPNLNGEHVWRPFQIAFVLLCLEGIVDPGSEDRNLADLLWFPTGGGKTEAYLALIAFTMFHRRLTKEDSGGVTALMRYTLRLLTIQQFERAALLICCCEDIRRSRSDLGATEISIGLWVGGDATPNTRADARLAIQEARRGSPPEKGNPIQVHSCPWCGIKLDANNYFVATQSSRPRLIVACRNDMCRFREGLPIHLIDEDIYDYRPTLLVATVDKFASMPWVGNRADLFNKGDSGRNRQQQSPPELIVQDELHLISGPLGTLSGLFETVIDAVCAENGHPPKVIASTATIRRAKQQASALFDREVRQFPPPGLDARNSYFAVEAPPDRRGDRLYVGLMAPGIAHAVLMIRTYAAILHHAGALEAPDAVRDPYWTLVGYFNSLRVLGGARMQVQDDVGDALSRLAQRTDSEERSKEFLIELNSRATSSQIPEYLKRMNVSLPDPLALDVILATNMISAGIDIDRLGLMVMMGQPQSTSEYIQATSRIGRLFPGLVVDVFNSSRSRDRSHYESFVAYHSALYRQVESTSVTPFSPRARDRGLHAVLIGMARMLLPRFRPNDGAREIVNHRQDLEAIAEKILDRVASTAPDEVNATRQHLNLILDQWQALADDVGNLSYNVPNDSTRSLLVEATGDNADDDTSFQTAWSLRDVDQSSELYLI